MRGERRVVVPPAPVRSVRAHRLLRHLTVPARERARRPDRTPDCRELRAGRGLVLELPGAGVLRARPATRPARTPSGLSAGARPGRTRATGLALPHSLTWGGGGTTRGPCRSAGPGTSCPGLVTTGRPGGGPRPRHRASAVGARDNWPPSDRSPGRRRVRAIARRVGLR